MKSASTGAHTTKGAELTELVLEVFRLNGLLLASGDELVATLGLTSARWQVLGAIALAEAPQSVAHTARSMGLTRQGVQRIVNELEAEGFVTFAENPHHARARWILLTKKGESAYRAAAERQAPWINHLAAELPLKDIKTALAVARSITAKVGAATE